MLQTSSQAEAMRAFLLEFQDRLCEQMAVSTLLLKMHGIALKAVADARV